MEKYNPFLSSVFFNHLSKLKSCFVVITLLIILLFNSCKTISSSMPIISRSRLNSEQLTAFLMYMNPNADEERVKRISSIYIEECEAESINSDIAFAQMCLETGFLSFKGIVKSEMNNFCGLGAIDSVHNGIVFKDEITGIRAHIQHLKAYASKKPLKRECVDPRYKYVYPKGKAPNLKSLTGKWATDPEYSNKLQSIIKRMYLFAL